MRDLQILTMEDLFDRLRGPRLPQPVTRDSWGDFDPAGWVSRELVDIEGHMHILPKPTDLGDFMHEAIEAATGGRYPIPSVLPKVRFFGQHELSRILGNRADGAHIHELRELFISDRLKGENDAYFKSVIVHELVHYLQAIDLDWNTKALFSADRIVVDELEAYSFQHRYLRRIDPWNRYLMTEPQIDQWVHQMYSVENMRRSGLKVYTEEGDDANRLPR